MRPKLQASLPVQVSLQYCALWHVAYCIAEQSPRALLSSVFQRMSPKASEQLSVLSITLKEQRERGVWLPVALAIAAAAFLAIPVFLKVIWADWISLFRCVLGTAVQLYNCNVEVFCSYRYADYFRYSGLYISNVYVGGFACIFASVYIANIGQEMV